MRYLAVLLAVTVLAGCAHRREGVFIRKHGAACEQLGYAGGSTPWAECTAMLDKYRIAKRTDTFQVPMANDPNRKMTCAFDGHVTTCK